MGESPGCLTRSFSQPSPSRGLKEGDPLRALTTSISFGRFMTEPLDWEKWSSFNHNRYLEEVEKYSKPGSVAAKKAYFEAHYKRIAAKKAAALLGEDNEAAQNSLGLGDADETCNGTPVDVGLAKSNTHVVIDETQGKEAPRPDPVFTVDASKCTLNFEKNEMGTSKIEGSESLSDQPASAVDPIRAGLPSQLEMVKNRSKVMSTQEENIGIKNAANVGTSANKKKSAVSSSKSSIYTGASKLQAPVKLAAPIHPRKEDNITPKCNKTERELFMEKKRATPKVLHMSINFASHVGESIKSSPVMQKIGNSRIAKTIAGTPKETLVQRTPARADSINGTVKHTSVTPQSVHRRSKTLLDRPVSGSRTMVGKSQSLFVDHSESPNACRKKAQSPIVSSSFTFRSEERAARRKEASQDPVAFYTFCLVCVIFPHDAEAFIYFIFQKLEEKLNARDTEKVQLQEKSKERAENMPQNRGLKAKPKESFHRDIKSPSHLMKKILPMVPYSPKLGRKPTSSVIQDSSSRPPWRPSIKTDGSKHATERKKSPMTHSISSLPKNMLENASPNIPLSKCRR
ncbi:hypothetical protein RJ640_030751 [Escallonia rubra]|uniref:TPX2 C-terminal domain-containing protein n=1 Tax=Escallonia rubra TaxID=112253 RepID=A0AA88R3N5_9ASTE|nr:hypothetical protein RJ640_030751 [Escallonia rubra]